MKTLPMRKFRILPALLALITLCACSRTRSPGVTLAWSDYSPGAVWAYSLDIALPDDCRGAKLVVSPGEDKPIAVFQPEMLRGGHMFYIVADEGAVRLCFPGGSHWLSLDGTLTGVVCLVSADRAIAFDENGCAALFTLNTGCKGVTVSLRII